MNTQQSEQSERRTFLMATMVFMPLATLSLVAVFGFVVWFSQSVFS